MLLAENEVLRDARALAGALGHLGLREGDALAVCCGNTPEFVAARDAAAALGLWFVPVNPRLAVPEIAYLAAKSRASLLLVDPEVAPQALDTGPRVVTFEDLRALGARTGPGPDKPAGVAGATLLFTSGTTGRPKGCQRTEEQERARLGEIVATYGLSARDVHLVVCPLAHSAPGVFLRAARSVGASTVLMRKFDAAGLLAAVAAHHASVFFLVPTQVERLLALPEAARAAADLSSVRAVVVAGAPFAQATKQRFLDWLGPGRLWEFYGSSETGTISVLPPAAQPGAPGCVGTPPAGVEVRVVVDDGGSGGEGREAAPGETGEVYVRSRALMRGYLGAEEAEAAWRDGFLSVGDLGARDATGALTLVDRKHDTIISGGVNVYPAEVERALCEHPAVAGAVACGLPDQEWGEIVAATVAARPGEELDEAEVRVFLRERIAGFKIPRRFRFVSIDELPTGSSGKPLRREARARFLLLA